MTPTLHEWLAAYRAAWIDRDPEAAAALFTADASYREQPYEEAFLGPGGVRDYWARVTESQRDVELVWGEPLADGDRAAVEWWVTMENGGAEITLAGCLLLRFEPSGLCRDLREYWHVAEGRRTPPPGWGA